MSLVSACYCPHITRIPPFMGIGVLHERSPGGTGESNPGVPQGLISLYQLHAPNNCHPNYSASSTAPTQTRLATNCDRRPFWQLPNRPQSLLDIGARPAFLKYRHEFCGSVK